MSDPGNERRSCALSIFVAPTGRSIVSTSSTLGFRSERGPILIALMLSTSLIALDSTILATAVPSIVADLGGLTQFPWLFSVYLLAQAVSVPVYAKLADTVGRKPVILVGIGLFLVGSILCGFAWDMGSLIVMRALQGLGAGAVLPMTTTIAADIYTVAERAKTQGYIASVWAVSSVVGPTLGGVFSQFASWRWIFFVNIPFCLLAAGMIWRNYDESVERRRHRIDYAGAAVLTVALTLLILAVLEGGQAWAWSSWQSVGSFAVGGVLLLVFGLIERQAAEPILPLEVLTRRLIVATCLIGIGVGAVLVGLTSYVPTFLERSTGATPIVAGLAVAALTIGWPISASQSGRLYMRIGFRPTALIGLVVATVGALALWLTSATPNVWATAALVPRRGLRPRSRRHADAHRGAGLGAVERACRRHGDQHVHALGRQRRRRRDLRRHRERRHRVPWWRGVERGGAGRLDGRLPRRRSWSLSSRSPPGCSCPTRGPRTSPTAARRTPSPPTSPRPSPPRPEPVATGPANPRQERVGLEGIGYVARDSVTDPDDEENAMSEHDDGTRKVADLIKDIRIAMLTHADSNGVLVSHPMATQEVEFDGDVLFVAERDSHKARDIATQSPARVNVAYSSNSSWVSLSGTATIVDDSAKLAELWNSFTGAWLEGGPENPNNIIIKVSADSAEYWDSPGAKVTQIANFVKAKVTGERIEGDNEVVDL